MTDSDPYVGVPVADLPAEEKARRASSFGGEASLYERFRPGPPVAAVAWMVPSPVHRIVDLGAGTGAQTRLLIERADEVVAVEPDDRMRSVLTEAVPAAKAVKGTGESMPLPDGSVDAVLASTSWHWMDPVPTLHEVARVLVPGGTVGAVWSGPDADGPFLAQARALLTGPPADLVGATPDGATGELASLLVPDGDRPASHAFEIPPGVPFDQPEHHVVTWDIALNADELIGLLGTFSWIITMPDAQRVRVVTEARRLLEVVLGVVGDVTVDVAFRADAYRARRHD